MATHLLLGQTCWSMSRDEESHRTYTIKFQVWGDGREGPAQALLTPGLPYYGSIWSYDGEYDPWAWCRWNVDVKQLAERDNSCHFELTFTFSTKPSTSKLCRESQFEDPLLEPMKLSGGFSSNKEEATRDRFGKVIKNSAWEQIRGQQNEWDAGRPTVKIEQNVPDLQLGLCTSMIQRLNDATLWGLSKRKIKLSGFTWEKKFYGTCYPYYTRSFEFEVNFDTWDRYIMDEATKVLKGHWNANTGAWVLENINGAAPSKDNPTHFDKYKDKNAENSKVILNGSGVPFVPINGTLQYWCINNGVDPKVGQFTCAEAVEEGRAQGARINGPWTTQAAADAVCVDTFYPDAQDPDDVVCTDNSPGRIKVQKYLETNFLQLGIPTTL